MPAADEKHINVLHISDTHFGAHDQEKVNALFDVVRKYQIDLACVTGDIAESPWWPDYFRQASTFLATLKSLSNFNVFTVPGNHDAFGRSMSLARYCKYMHVEANFYKHVSLKGIDVCIFGIDTTAFSVRHANNSGSFSDKSKDLLVNNIAKVKGDLGEHAFRRALKICLVHHHPMPTGSSRLEGMLYFKNSGAFLKIAGAEGMDLVLHGHQHDPHYYRLDYNIGVDTESLVVLSAGTVSKKVDEQAPLAERSQFYIIKVYQSKTMEIESFNYYKIDKRFENSRYIETRPKRRNVIARRKDIVEYKLLTKGDMAVCERRNLSAEPGEKVESLHIVMGVDDKCSECADRQRLGLKIYRGDQELVEGIEWLEDGARRKRVRVSLSNPIELEPVEVKWTYTWPGGFVELLRDGRAAGTFLTVDPTDSLAVEFVSDTHDIKNFDVVYHDMKLLRHLHEGDLRRRGFEIQNPTRTQIVQFRVRI